MTLSTQRSTTTVYYTCYIFFKVLTSFTTMEKQKNATRAMTQDVILIMKLK